jgi:hypothetical protein
MDLKGTGSDNVYWIYLVQEKDQWRAVVNTIMKVIRTVTKLYASRQRKDFSPAALS